jgi:hypothetical protein
LYLVRFEIHIVVFTSNLMKDLLTG